MSNGVDFRKLALGLRGQLTAAQSELAALREELEKLGDDYCKRTDELIDSQQRLADAERRNAELIGVLEMFADNSDDGDVVELSRYHIALTKPEEAKS